MKKLKKNWKKIVAVIAVCLVSFSVLGAITGAVLKDSDTIGSHTFSRGDLDENGKYVASEQSIYTKNAFKCKGLRVEPDFEAELTYDVYYYDASGALVEAKKALTEAYDEDYPLAMTCRIVIHPEIPEDVDEDDYKIGFLEVYKIAEKVKITVDKNQDYLYSKSVNEYDSTKIQTGYGFVSYEKGAALVLVEAEGYQASNEIAVNSEFNKYDIYVRCADKSALKIVAVAADAEDVILCSSSISLSSVAEGDWCKLTIDLDDIKGAAEADKLLVTMPAGAECYVFGYAD
ncbi:MAG: hypothetical protein E7612_06590 [Ruminococcaceae bacterium]|nr:hypothetical protein [Oscillospiraceae bacterium]